MLFLLFELTQSHEGVWEFGGINLLIEFSVQYHVSRTAFFIFGEIAEDTNGLYESA
jgi:hypothetical protein